MAEKDKAFMAELKKFDREWKAAHGYDPKITKEQMRELGPKGKADRDKLYNEKLAKKKAYKLNSEQEETLRRGLALPRTAFLTSASLADLAEKEPVIFGAYAQFICRSTKSKGLERDEPYYYGDSRLDNGKNKVVTDGFIESVNAENGMRFSSWSDWRIIHLLDYVTAIIDLSVRKAAMHGYTKYTDEVRALGRTGMMFNMSGVLQGRGLKEDGSLDFSPTESINLEEALRAREDFPETAGLQCIAVSDESLRALLDSDFIDYVIPYHRSGLSKELRKIAGIEGWTDYEGEQNAKKIDKDKKNSKVERWHEEPVFSEFFVGYDTGMSGIEAMRASAQRYIDMCRERGMTPKFERFVDHPNYWKLLIDRKMVNQKTGELIRQKPVVPKFDFDLLRELVDKEVNNSNQQMREGALQYVLDHLSDIPKVIKELKEKGVSVSKVIKKAEEHEKKRKNSIMGGAGRGGVGREGWGKTDGAAEASRGLGEAI
ncbi:MAG: hypothetical protein LIP02_04945 [Bacteroidales bacterium]|nr:hypothetical protein [Bacteroidales bacterium]